MLTIRLALGVIFVAGTPALAAELPVPSKIAAVTVYPSGATVVRTANITLPIGATTVLIDNLPLEIDPASLKVDGAASAALAIASVETRTVHAETDRDPERIALQAEIEAISDKITAADDRIAALEGRRRFLDALINATPGGFSKALAEGGGADVAQWAAAAATIGDGLAAVADEQRGLRIGERDLNKQLQERQAALEALPQPGDHVAVRVALEAAAAETGTLTITYRTASAQWVPTYDAQLSTGDAGGKPTLAIVRRAEVTQATGEDWSNVALTLSTARTTEGTAAPTLQPFLVSLYDPNELRGGALNSEAAAPLPAAKSLDAVGNLADSDHPARVVLAAADFGDFRAEYHVPGLVSVESDAGARSMQIATVTVPAQIEVKAVPMLSDDAYLQASFVPPQGAPLLPGRVALFRDGVFVGNGAVPFTNPGNRLDLGFGIDDNVHVVRTALDRQLAGPGFLQNTKTDRRRFKITVENLHRQPIDIVVLDRVPYSEDETVTITPVSDETAPTATNVDDQRGVLAWRYTYAAGEKREILNGYEVSWPADREIALD